MTPDETRKEAMGKPSWKLEEILPVIDASCDCDKCVSRTTHKYEVRGKCHNCGARFIVRCRKGDKTPPSVDCPNCECSAYGWVT